MKIPEMWDAALEGRLKGLWIIGYDVAQTDPNLHKVREALGRLEFLVVQDLFMSQTAKLAHLVILGASFLEKDGTSTNLHWQVVSEVSAPMGYPMHYSHPIQDYGRDEPAHADARRGYHFGADLQPWRGKQHIDDQ